jgi:hypothetical protein
MRSRYVTIAGSAAALLIGFAGGRLSVSPAASAPQAQEGLETAGKIATARQDRGEWEPLLGPKPTDRSAGRVEAANYLGEVLSEPPGFSRVRALDQALERVTDKNWRDTFEVFWKAHTQGLVSEDEYRLMLNRIGEAGGREVCERFKPKDPVAEADTHNGRNAMAGWAQQDPAAARQYLESLPAGRFREGMLWGYVHGIALQDPKSAVQLLKEVPVVKQAEWLRSWIGQTSSNAFESLGREWLANSPVSSSASGEEIEPLQTSVFDALFSMKRRRGWADPDGSKTTAFVEEFASRPFVSASTLSSAALALTAKRSHTEAIEWVQANGRPEASALAMTGIIQDWAKRAPAEASAWLDANRDSAGYDEAVVGLLTGVPNLDPGTAMAWVDTIQNPRYRDMMSARIQRAKR